MKVKCLIAQLEKLDQEQTILIATDQRGMNFQPFRPALYITKKEMQHRADLFLWTNVQYDKKKFPPKEVYLLQ
jgi:hypothetical protein